MKVPAPAAVPPPRLPRVRRETLAGGLVVAAARRRGVPVVEVRLRIPAPTTSMADNGAKRVLARTLLSGTATRRDTDIAAQLQAAGGGLTANAGPDAVTLSGSALAGRFGELLAVLGDVLTGATYPRARVRNQRDRLAQELVIRRSDPQTAAAEALARRMYGTHPYGLGLPTNTAIARAGSQALRRLHDRAVLPDGAELVVVGDVRAGDAIEAIAGELAGWQGGDGGAAVTTPLPPGRGPITIVDRPGAVQTNIRLGAPTLSRSDPGYPALALAQLVFGGYFGSRLSANLREDKGYSYSPRSQIDHRRAASRIVVTANVAAEVTAAAVVETLYELGRIATVPIDAAELDRARRYRTGTLMISIQTQAGLAGQISRLMGAGLDERYLRDLPRALDRVTPADVLEAARVHLRPDNFSVVLLGDAAAIHRQVEALGDVRVVAG